MGTLLQDYDTGFMSTTSNRFKMIAYNYDLISGKVNMVEYQPPVWKEGKLVYPQDYFAHRYQYDAENRLTDVETSRDKMVWDKDARYFYYKHGPLARTILGQNQVQGLDYAYTLQGWLKGINSTAVGEGSYDMGGDGKAGGGNSNIGRDAYGFALSYYNNDYNPISSSVKPFANAAAAGFGFKALYNGNIAAMGVNIPKIGEPLLYTYTYDQLNRITKMFTYKGLNQNTNSWNISSVQKYREQISYDANGNIQTYKRNGDDARSNVSSSGMDDLTYTYKPNTNQLDKVLDVAQDAADDQYDKYNDIKKGQETGNYQYDEIGNLISDKFENISKIKWTVYGKISTIEKTDNTIISYTYDASGNRISKTVGGKETDYVRDASGNVMSIYTKDVSINNGDLTQTEIHLYGSSRLGVYNLKNSVQQEEPNPGRIITFTRGNKFFELSNHLGNVLATVSDKKLQYSSDNTTIDYFTADVVSANDYYPFGMMMPGRKYSVANTNYRYGFNGKENDNEMKGEGNQQDYGMRIYDPRLGRFLSEDPITKKYPELTPYQFASNTPIQAIDLDGKEAFFIHGTASGPESWSPKLTQFIKENLTNNIHSDSKFSWQDRNGYLNTENDRKNAAFDLVLHIMDYRQKNKITDEEITLIGHSHGGNIDIQAAHYLNDIYGIRVNIINFNTPAYNGSKDAENPQVGYGIYQLIHYWTKQDDVAGGAAGDDKYKDGVRTKVTNIELNNPLKKDALRSHFQENINLEELDIKKIKPDPIPSWLANPTKNKYDPTLKQVGISSTPLPK